MKRICIIAFFLFFSISCAHLDPSLRKETIAPGALQRGEVAATGISQAKEPEQDALFAAESEEDALETSTILREMEKKNTLFNQRLQSVLEKSQHPEATRKGVDGKAAAPDGSAKKKVSFDFYDTDITDVIRLFMELLAEDFSIDENVGGRISLHIEDNFNEDQLWELLKGILRINSVTMVRDQHLWRFIPLSEAPQSVSAENVLLGGDMAPSRGQVIQGFKLRYIATAELINIIKPYLSKGALVYAYDPQGVLLVCDYPHTLMKIDKFIDLFDVSVFADVHTKVYTLNYVLVESVITELTALAQSFGLGFDQSAGPDNRISFLGLDRLNKLLVLTKNSKLLEFVDVWVEELDRELPQIVRQEQEENIFVYYAQNGDAENIVSTLQGLFQDVAKPANSDKSGANATVPLGQQLKSVEVKQPETGATGTVSGTLSGPVSFVVDTTTNAILTRCLKTDWEKIQTVIEKLDVYPKQVLIEVLIADVKLDESSALGIEWSYVFDLKDDLTGTLNVDSGLGVIGGGGSSLIGSGLTYLVSNTDNFTAVLKTFADKNQVRVLSSPHILASDNQPATINIGDEVPIVTSELRTTEAGSTATTVDKTIQYRNIGIILNVTPHINERGLVRMEISQEVSEVSQTQVEGVESPVFSQRSAETKLAVMNNQTIVIGGLIRQNQSNGYTGLPILGRIPILKYLVGTETKDWESSELLIFITPRVIKSELESSTLTQTFVSRLNDIRRHMQ